MDWVDTFKRLFLLNRPHVSTKQEMTGIALGVDSYKSPQQTSYVDAVYRGPRSFEITSQTFTCLPDSSAYAFNNSGLIKTEQPTAIKEESRPRPKLVIVKSDKADM